MARVFVIKCSPCPGNEAGTLRIDEADYDKSKHTLLYIEGEEGAKPDVKEEPKVEEPKTETKKKK